MPAAVEELLRYESPSQHTARLAPDDVMLGGKQIRKRQAVIAVMAAGNRDPERFPDPDRLDFDRPDNRHLAFGWAAHFCFGAPLARIEGQIAFETLLHRFPRLELTDEPLVWRENLGLRGLKSLPLSLRRKPMITAAMPATPRLRRPRLRPARFEDYPQIQRLESSHLAAHPAGRRVARLSGWTIPSGRAAQRRLADRLGARRRRRPRGRLAEQRPFALPIPAASELVCANGRAWVCRPEYRGFALVADGRIFQPERRGPVHQHHGPSEGGAGSFGPLRPAFPLATGEPSPTG